MEENQDHFNILRTIDKKPNFTQRELATKLGFSLGKLNYLLQALKKKGLIKINHFKKNKKKIGYIYVLTPAGISKRTKFAINFINFALSKESINERKSSNTTVYRYTFNGTYI